jgi:prepilin-type N-terminal cleavage/methylation domain-containing protein
LAAGFTLVELLVVIAIIAVLSSMITVVAFRVRKTGKNATIKIDVMNLDQALSAYKEKFGAYPPDFSNFTDVQQHFAVAFPRCAYNSTQLQNALNSLPGGMPTPASALTFWLGGMPELTASLASGGTPTGRYLGFSADPTDPLDYFNPQGVSNPTTWQQSRIGPFFDFDISRVGVTVNGATTTHDNKYYPNNGLGNVTTNTGGVLTNPNSPYVYFAARNGIYTSYCSVPPVSGSTQVICTPYVDWRVNQNVDASWPTSQPNPLAWVNPKTFQILCPGLDGQYSGTLNPVAGVYMPGQYPTGANYGQNTLDDITNFTVKVTLGDDKPE